MTRWRIELSTVAEGTLRRLKRADRHAVALRLDELAGGGPPPASADGEIQDLPAGDYRLLCRVSRNEQRIVVITIQHQRTPASRVVVELAMRKLRFWTGEGWVNGMRRTVQAFRRLARAPVFSVTAVATLALGIGAATATFAVASGVLFSTLPYGEPSRVVSIWSRWSDFPKTWVSIEEFLHYRSQARTLEDAALYFVSSHNLTTVEDPERLGSAVLTHNLFDVLRVRPAVGRFFTREEAMGEASVLVLGYDLWQRRFRGDRDIIGSQLPVNGRPWTIVGVAPAGFVLPEDFRSQGQSQIYFPLPLDVDQTMEVPVNGGSHGYFALGRLADGADVGSARQDLENLSARLEAEGIYRASWGFRPLVLSVRDDVLGATKRMLYVLLGACGLLLLISCGNVGALLLTRGDTRRHAVNIMRSLGASRRRILSELLLESAVLAAVGGALGWLLAHGSLLLFERLNAGAIPSGIELGLDGRVLAFASVVTTSTVVLFGWLPSSRIAGSSEAVAAHQSTRHTRRAGRGRRWVVAGQIGLSVVLLLGSGLMLRTMAELSDIDPGFRTEGVVTFSLTAPSATYPDEEAVAGFYDELLRRLRELPGVRSAGAARLLPLASQMGDAGVWAEGYVRSEDESTTAEWQWVTPGYLETMGIPTIRGRDFHVGDDRAGPSAVLINEAFARRYFQTRDPIGSRINSLGGDTATVVGVVGDVRHNEIGSPARPRFYRPLAQVVGTGTSRRMTIVAKVEGRAADYFGSVRGVVGEMDPSMPVAELLTMNEVRAASIAAPRFTAALLAAFAAVALGLSVVGLYGVLSYSVTQQRRDIGVRMALGAPGSRVVREILREGFSLIILGLGAGVAAAFALSGLLGGLVYGITTTDPSTFLAVPVLLLTVCLIATWVPAARAARIQPSEALVAE